MGTIPPHVLIPSSSCVGMVMKFEGLKLEVYADAAGHRTVGYGHRTDMPVGEKITPEDAGEYLAFDLHVAAMCIRGTVKPPLHQQEFDALVSFVFNVGCKAFSQSSMLKLLNERKFFEAAKEFAKWDHAGGHVLPGLLDRRNSEAAMFVLGIEP